MYLVSIGKDSSFASSFANQASPQFKRKIRWKLQFILTILQYGYSVLYVDSDVILLKNTFPVLKNYKQYDVVAQRDGRGICTGFIFLPSNKRTIQVMKHAKSLVYTKDYRDQVAVNDAVKATKASMLLLPVSSFPSGYDFFSKYQFYWDRKGNEWMSGLTSRRQLLHVPQQLCERSLWQGVALQGDEDARAGREWRVQR